MKDGQRTDGDGEDEIQPPMRRIGADANPSVRKMTVDDANSGAVNEDDDNQDQYAKADFPIEGWRENFIESRVHAFLTGLAQSPRITTS
jgi:hypothetical protein